MILAPPRSRRAAVALACTATAIIGALLGLTWLGIPGTWAATAAAVAMILLPRAFEGPPEAAAQPPGNAPEAEGELPVDPAPRFRLRGRADLRALGLATALTLLPFPLAFHVWHGVLLEAPAEPRIDAARMARLRPDLSPHGLSMVGPRAPDDPPLRVWSTGGWLHILAPELGGDGAAADAVRARVGIRTMPEQPAPPRGSWTSAREGAMRAGRPITPLAQPGAARGGRVSLDLKLDAGRGAAVALDGVAEVSLHPVGGSLRVETPAAHVEADADGGLRWPRDLWWIPIFLFTHVVAVALPEELFFRGFVQRVLRPWLGEARWRLFGAPFPWAVVASSALFAAIHVVTVPSPTRLSVFFPGLLFGWLYERTGNLTVPILFHALCNLALAICQAAWFG